MKLSRAETMMKKNLQDLWAYRYRYSFLYHFVVFLTQKLHEDDGPSKILM